MPYGLETAEFNKNKYDYLDEPFLIQGVFSWPRPNL